MLLKNGFGWVWSRVLGIRMVDESNDAQYIHLKVMGVTQPRSERGTRMGVSLGYLANRNVDPRKTHCDSVASKTAVPNGLWKRLLYIGKYNRVLL